MKNEVFARAMTGIDDDIINEAHTAAKKTKLRIVRTVCSAAACIAVVIIAALLLFFDGVSIKTDGVYTGSAPFDVHSPATFANEPSRAVSVPSVSVLLEIKARKAVTVSASCGEITVYGAEGRTVFSGETFEGNPPLSVVWTVESPNPKKTYTLTVNGKIITLKAVDGEWITEK